jgi:hypothetical protein
MGKHGYDEADGSVDNERVYALRPSTRDDHVVSVYILLQHSALVKRTLSDSDETSFFSATALQAVCDKEKGRCRQRPPQT